MAQNPYYRFQEILSESLNNQMHWAEWRNFELIFKNSVISKKSVIVEVLAGLVRGNSTLSLSCKDLCLLEGLD